MAAVAESFKVSSVAAGMQQKSAHKYTAMIKCVYWIYVAIRGVCHVSVAVMRTEVTCRLHFI